MKQCKSSHMSKAIAWIVGVVVGCGAAVGADPPAPVYWKQDIFSIPYQVSRPSTADAPVEVQLLVSRDGGANWQTLESAEPQVKGFIYRAEDDGPYWFAVKTIDRYGRFSPADDVRPQLHVVVDTKPPVLDLESEVTSRGEILLRFRASDPNLSLQTLSITARVGDGGFAPIQMPPLKDLSTTDVENELRLPLPPANSVAEIRAEVRDLANNRSIAQIAVDPRRTGPQSTRSISNESPSVPPIVEGPRLDAAADTSAQSQTGTWRGVNPAPYPPVTAGLDSDLQNSLLGPPPLDSSSVSTSTPSTAQAWPVDQTTLTPPASQSESTPPVAAQERGLQHEPVARAETLPPPGEASRRPWTTRPASALLNPAGGQIPSQNPASLPSTVSSQSPPPMTANQQGTAVFGAPAEEIPVGSVVRPSGGSLQTSPADYPNTGAPIVSISNSSEPESHTTVQPLDAATSSVQMVNSRTIAIDYEVASVGPWGVSEVELWGTSDGGQTWRRYAADDDNRSPVMATVEGEGEYGFRVIVHSAGGFAAPRPQPGDLPEVMVRVDLVRPQAVIESVQQGTGNSADQIIIRWSADDKQLASHPVTLYYAPQPAGPWSIIAAGLQNSGNYVWRAERHLPEELYVRLEVRDAAGNSTTFQTAQPVVVQRPRPQVRIREVRPLQSSAAYPLGSAQR